MSEDFQDKTEEATPKKIQDARKKGQVAKSQDLTGAFVLVSGMFGLLAFSSFLFEKVVFLSTGVFQHLNEPFGDLDSVVYWGREGIQFIVAMTIPILATVFIAALLITTGQVGLLFSIEPLKPKMKTLNIFDFKNYKKFFNLQAVMKLVFGLSKMAVVSVICFLFIRGLMNEMSNLMKARAWDILIFIVWNSFLIGMFIAILLVVLGIMEFAYQKWKFKQDMKMTKQDVKDERKQTEGDAQVKSKLRSMMQSMTRTRMKSNIPESDVVVSNPVHYAIAIKYDAENMGAPMCTAKGARLLALQLKDIAKENKVPIVENPPLARALYRVVEVGEPVPPDFYHAVAEVLAYVYRMNEKTVPGHNPGNIPSQNPGSVPGAQQQPALID